jgi:hypothetical protein
VVPATPDRPKTVTEPELWAVRHTPEPKIWPRTLVTGESPEPVLAAPSPASFGIEKFGPVTKVAMAQTFERKVVSDGSATVPQLPPWPRPVAYSVPGRCPCAARAGRAQFQVFPRIPIGATRQTEGGGQEARGGSSRPRRSRPTACSGPAPAARPRAFGHQLSGVRPPTNV